MTLPAFILSGRSTIRALSATALLTFSPAASISTLRAQSAPDQARATSGAEDTSSVTARLALLQRRVDQLERQRPARDSATPFRGFYIRSSDGAHQIRLRGLLQSDTRMLDGKSAAPAATTFLVRRARPILEITSFRILDARFVPDFGQGTAIIYDAHVDLRLHPWLAVRAGKFKSPVGLERLQSVADVLFIERGMPTNLVPQRDVGAQVYGDIKGGLLAYALGAFNGAVDLGIADADNGSTKDIGARLFAQPFVRSDGPLKGLGVGVGFSDGVQRGTPGTAGLPSYRSPAQQSVFSYRTDGTAAGTAVAAGTRQRVAPQGYWYGGPVGVLAEYTVESQDVHRGTTDATLTHRAWQLSGSVVLTGENASFRSVTPRHPYGTAGGRGAFELGARVGSLDLDDATFPLFADPAVAVSRANSVGAILVWHLAPGIKAMAELDRTRYTGGGATGDRATENALLVRLQHGF